jgi:CubicO group peptidase (beta-lactamase class C family)
MISAQRLGLAVCIVLTTAFINPRAQSPGADDPLLGVWVSETTSGQALHGQITIAREGSSWRANLSNAESTFQLTGESVSFALPGNSGQFRGVLTENGRAITGFWLQPATAGFGQQFASPLVLQLVKRNVWRGMVRPLEDRFTLYLRILRGLDGSLMGAFRNPEQNSRGGAPQFSVSRAGDTVLFTTPTANASAITSVKSSAPIVSANAPLTATFATSPDRLQISWPDLGRTINLTRGTPQQSAAFFPHPPGEPKYAYSKPPETGDGWGTARAGEVGMDEAQLARLVQRLIDADPSVRRPSLIHSALVARHGKLVLEEYFFGFDRDKPHDMRSAGKTFASVMLGAGMRQGSKLTPETRAFDLLAGMGPFANPDPRKSQITLAQLMTHTSGLACDDSDDASPGNEDAMQRQRQQPNWWKHTLDLPVANDPGSRYAYCSAGMNLVGAALTTATGTWLPELFERTVARPLQFGPHYWNLMPNGEGYMGGGAYIRPRDLLKVGQTYLDGGVWRGQRIVDSSWVMRSTASHVHISPATTGLAPDKFQDFYAEADDGYAWHLAQLRVGDRYYRQYAATGNGGQLLIVVPELDLAVVFTAGNYGQGGIWGRFRDQIVAGEIIPAIRR